MEGFQPAPSHDADNLQPRLAGTATATVRSPSPYFRLGCQSGCSRQGDLSG